MYEYLMMILSRVHHKLFMLTLAYILLDIMLYTLRNQREWITTLRIYPY